MADTFPHFRDAARALLAIDCLTEREGQFCPSLTVDWNMRGTLGLKSAEIRG